MISQAEQYLLELINRGRLDPQAEADRYGRDLNQGLADGTITTDAKQVLAPNEQLELAAQLHSLWMLDANVFSHTGQNGSSLRDRAEAGGYNLFGSWRLGENLAWAGTTGFLNLEAQIDVHHEGLYLSSGHRRNLMDGRFREIGVAQEEGVFTSNGVDYNASMLTEKFGKRGTDIFVTGVVYDDLDNNNFFSIGEGRSGATFTVGTSSDVSASAGGYGLAFAPQNEITVTINYQSFSGSLKVFPGGENVKVDLVDGSKVLLSKSAELLSGVMEAELLGIEDLSLIGSDASDVLTGNNGNNTVDGGLGADTVNSGLGDDNILGGDGQDHLTGSAGNDTIYGGNDADLLLGGLGNDSLLGQAGADTIFGGSDNDTLRGGAQDDVLFGDAGTDALFGDDGMDVLVIDGASDVVDGGTGFDRVRLENTAGVSVGWANWTSVERAEGDEGNDTISAVGETSGVVILGAAGEDSLVGGSEFDQLYGGSGADILQGGAGDKRDILVGEGGADTLEGGLGNDLYFIEADGDVIIDTGGYDRARAFDANLQFNIDISGWIGVDQLSVSNLDDTVTATGYTTELLLLGNGGADDLTGGDLDDRIFGGTGDDTLRGGDGQDSLFGDSGNDLFFGGEGDDLFYLTDDGDRVVDGGVGFDNAIVREAGLTVSIDGSWSSLERIEMRAVGGTIDATGYAETLTISGFSGDDNLIGGSSADVIMGGIGADTINGGAGGDDTLFGGGVDSEVDTFVFEDGTGTDTIFDFEEGVDLIDVTGITGVNGFADVLITTSGGDSTITAGAETIILNGITTLEAADFA